MSAADAENTTGGKLHLDKKPRGGNLSRCVAHIQACLFPLTACTNYQQAMVNSLDYTGRKVTQDHSCALLLITKRQAKMRHEHHLLIDSMNT